jgi:hypothetical protein
VLGNTGHPVRTFTMSTQLGWEADCPLEAGALAEAFAGAFRVDEAGMIGGEGRIAEE